MSIRLTSLLKGKRSAEETEKPSTVETVKASTVTSATGTSSLKRSYVKWYEFLRDGAVGDVLWIEAPNARTMQTKISSRASDLGVIVNQRACLATTKRQPYDVYELIRIKIIERKGA